MFDKVSATQVALSGLVAQRIRMAVIANNIANAETPSTPGDNVFAKQLTIFRGDYLKDGPRSKFGVRVKEVLTDETPPKLVLDPTHPMADATGMVAYPNVNLAEEMVNLTSAQRAYEANIAVVVSGKRMRQKALEIIQA
jgi:flagellar basal-body rod protein FlgC